MSEPLSDEQLADVRGVVSAGGYLHWSKVEPLLAEVDRLRAINATLTADLDAAIDVMAQHNLSLPDLVHRPLGEIDRLRAENARLSAIFVEAAINVSDHAIALMEREACAVEADRGETPAQIASAIRARTTRTHAP